MKAVGRTGQDRTADISYSNLYEMEIMKPEGDQNGKRDEEIKKQKEEE